MTPVYPRWIVPLAVTAIALLVAMFAITLATGVSQETFEIYLAPAVYAAKLREHAAAAHALFAIDSAFLVTYTALLAGFARAIAVPGTQAATLLAIAIGCVLATALLDMVEDHHILAMLRAAQTGADPASGEIVAEHAISQVKFNISYVGLFLIGLHAPRDTLAGKLLGWLLTAGTLAQSVWLYAAPDDMLPLGNMGRWVGFLAGFGLMIAVVRAARTRPADAEAVHA